MTTPPTSSDDSSISGSEGCDSSNSSGDSFNNVEQKDKNTTAVNHSTSNDKVKDANNIDNKVEDNDDFNHDDIHEVSFPSSSSSSFVDSMRRSITEKQRHVAQILGTVGSKRACDNALVFSVFDKSCDAESVFDDTSISEASSVAPRRNTNHHTQKDLEGGLGVNEGHSEAADDERFYQLGGTDEVLRKSTTRWSNNHGHGRPAGLMFNESDAMPDSINENEVVTSKAQPVPEDYQDHLGDGRQYWRDIILGVNDGLVSTFLLVAGVSGTHMSNNDILLTALSGTIAGAISMAAGEYVATKTQTEVMEGEIALERKHIATNREAELKELSEVLGVIGIPEDDDSEEVTNLRNQLLEYYAKHDEAHLLAHIALELGVLEEEKRSEFVAGGVAFFLFIFGAMPSVIPFCITQNTNAAFIAAAICTTCGLLIVGGIKTWATRGDWKIAAMENLLIAAGGGSIAFGIGAGFDQIINGN